MLKILLITAVMLLFGYFLIRNLLKPLISLVVNEQKNTEVEKAWFIAATEGD